MDVNTARSQAIEYLSKYILLSEFNPDDFTLYGDLFKSDHFFFHIQLINGPFACWKHGHLRLALQSRPPMA